MNDKLITKSTIRNLVIFILIYFLLDGILIAITGKRGGEWVATLINLLLGKI